MQRARLLCCLGVGLWLVASGGELRGQAATNNPTGPAGQFNGNVTTAGSYDPYTGNIVRSVTDISVAGAVGEYGLSLSRTWTSREVGGWRHSFSWNIRPVLRLPDGEPIPYTVSFPDGRVLTFGPPALGDAWRAAPGTRERFNPNLCYLLLSDGGKVQFSRTETKVETECVEGRGCTTYRSYSFKVLAIVDPYGLRTTFTPNADGSYRITEPGGRWIQLTFTANGEVDAVEASDGRIVDYIYTTITPGNKPYSMLTSVQYPPEVPGGTPVASYTYVKPNVGSADGPPILKTCDDPMYSGPMKKIFYTYASANNPNGTPAVYGQILSEKRAAADPTPVSKLTINTATTRTETRADGKTRTFVYDTRGLLKSVTDFKGIAQTQTYDANLYVDTVTDRRGYTTNFTNDPLTGKVTRVQFPAVSSVTPATAPRGTVTSTYGWAQCPDINNRDANNPYYLYSVTDEGGNVRRFTRDALKRVVRIDYPDDSFETFSYDNNSFNQVVTHVMKTGGTESFTYNPVNGRKLTYRDAYHEPIAKTGKPSAWFDYDAQGRLSTVTDPLGSALGDGDHTTSYDYNARGQLTTTTLPKDPVDGVRHTIVNAYNLDGTLASRTDQRLKSTTYSYDDYRRLRTVTTPLRAAGDTTNRVTSLFYAADQAAVEDYTHTGAQVRRLVLPSGKMVKTFYDENYRKMSEIPSAADGVTDAATTSLRLRRRWEPDRSESAGASAGANPCG